MSDFIDSQTPQGYQAIRQHELNGTGFASNQQTPWPAQQAAARAQEAQAAAAAARADQARKARIAWQPSKGMRKGR